MAPVHRLLDPPVSETADVGPAGSPAGTDGSLAGAALANLTDE